MLKRVMLAAAARTDDAVQAELRARRSKRDAVLAIVIGIPLAGVAAYYFAMEGMKETDDTAPAFRSPQDVWCTEAGDCHLDAGACQQRGTCTRTENYACLKLTTRASSTQVVDCWRTFDACVRRERAVRSAPETKSVDASCVRYRKDR